MVGDYGSWGSKIVIISAFREAEEQAVAAASSHPDVQTLAARTDVAIRDARTRTRMQLHARGYTDTEIDDALIEFSRLQ
ncbi:hypothetical protein HNQ07_002114 [Deinococcus metalli]|uniref:Uncharacterized protein n=1 Tax=Deinococcus metalli TaxID=1141878 RepID=A0A7W8KEX2_9DEIO|nr:hypothetical protein [Deinococcus metalli]MBB5376650.1 hypothetical protein [Deinococcus metalli]GHF42509.1 hypothetical protein GCM10017781_18520 [Deinococcus metalli]